VMRSLVIAGDQADRRGPSTGIPVTSRRRRRTRRRRWRSASCPRGQSP
jgi:hypothetical protein